MNIMNQLDPKLFNSKFKSYFSTYFYRRDKNIRKKSNIFLNGEILSNQDNNKNGNKGNIEIIRHQVVFIVDVTSSMNMYITGTKERIEEFIETLKHNIKEDIEKEYPEKKDSINYIFEVAIVAYRDFRDEKHFETLDFTSNLDQVKNFLKSLKVHGGDDLPEDVEGALIHALFGIDNISKKLSWTMYNNVASRMIILLADSPPHGLLINGVHELADNYPDAKVDEWNEIFKEISNLKISFIVARLTEFNDKANTFMANLCEANNIKFNIVDITQKVNGKNNTFESASAYKEMAEHASTCVKHSTTHYIDNFE